MMSSMNVLLVKKASPYHVLLFTRSLLAPDSMRSLPLPSEKVNVKAGNQLALTRARSVSSSTLNGRPLRFPARCCMATTEVSLPVRYCRGGPHIEEHKFSANDLPVPDALCPRGTSARGYH